VSHFSYMDGHAFIDMESLDYRCLNTDIVMMYEIVQDLVDVDRNSLITANSSSVAGNSFMKL